MPTTITIAEDLLREAQKLSGKAGYSDAIVTSLEDYVALRKRLSLLEDLFNQKSTALTGAGKDATSQEAMVLIDTSIWIAFYRKQDSALAQKLWMLAARNEAAVSGQVWVELLGGFRRHSVRSSYQIKLGAYPFLETTRAACDRAAELLATHPRLGAGDAIIAATASESQSAPFTRFVISTL